VKVLVFAHTPPPHHGQSYMVKQVLDRVGAAGDIELHHVNCRFSTSIDDIGHGSLRKLGLLLKYCAQALRLRFRHGLRHFYYIPAPGLRSAILRDWLVMALCRPFFPHVIYHWQAAGLGEWIEGAAGPVQRRLSLALLGRPTLSIVLGEANRREAEILRSHQIAVIPNAIPDPCPGFDTDLLPLRLARAAARRTRLTGAPGTPDEFRVLSIGLCLREKGLFDTVEAIALANARPEAVVPIRLVVAGSFWRATEQAEFEERLRRPDLRRDGRPLVEYRGFVTGEAKQALFRDSDCLCFPTYYPAETFGIVVIEAMAHGLPVVASRWRAIPEVLPPGSGVPVDVKSPRQIADALLALSRQDYDPALRARFLGEYTAERFGARMTAALRSLPR